MGRRGRVHIAAVRQLQLGALGEACAFGSLKVERRLVI